MVTFIFYYIIIIYFITSIRWDYNESRRGGTEYWTVSAPGNLVATNVKGFSHITGTGTNYTPGNNLRRK